MKPPRHYRQNLTAWAIHVVITNWHLAGLRLLAAANDDGPGDTPAAA
jgi:hypothetical protein